jgi:hypothetical protein
MSNSARSRSPRRSVGIISTTERRFELERRFLRLRHVELPAGAAYDSPHDVVVGWRRMIHREPSTPMIAAC